MCEISAICFGIEASAVLDWYSLIFLFAKFQANDEHHEKESATGTRVEDRHQKAEIS